MGRDWNAWLLGSASAVALLAGCAREPIQPAESFSWSAQPISLSPPPSTWRREAENSGGLLGVRFVLTGGLGECITVAAYATLAEHDRRKAIASLIADRDSLSRREFLKQLSLARARTDDPVSEREAAAARAINAALDEALTEYLGERMGYADVHLQEALQAASSYEMTLDEILPRIRLRPENRQEPERWLLGYQRDTTIVGRAAFAGDDTLITPVARLLYRQVFWVVKGVPFQAVYQGTKANEPVFDRLLASIQFPEGAGDTTP